MSPSMFLCTSMPELKGWWKCRTYGDSTDEVQSRSGPFSVENPFLSVSSFYGLQRQPWSCLWLEAVVSLFAGQYDWFICGCVWIKRAPHGVTWAPPKSIKPQFFCHFLQIFNGRLADRFVPHGSSPEVTAGGVVVLVRQLVKAAPSEARFPFLGWLQDEKSSIFDIFVCLKMLAKPRKTQSGFADQKKSCFMKNG